MTTTTTLRFFPAFRELSVSGNAVEVHLGSTPAQLLAFNGVEAARLLELARAASGGGGDDAAVSKVLHEQLADLALRERVEKGGAEAAAAAAAEATATATHVGFPFQAKLGGADGDGPTKSLRVRVLSRAGADEKKALLVNMFGAALTAGARLGLSPEDIGHAFKSVCKDEGGATRAGGEGAAMQQAMQQAMGGMAGAMGGMAAAMGGGGPSGGGGQQQCKQQ
jgi:hypothetical protein